MLCLVVLPGFGEPLTVGADLIQQRGGLSYVPNESEPYTGRSASFYENGQLSYESIYVDGKKNGLERYLLENGALVKEMTFIDGKWMTTP